VNPEPPADPPCNAILFRTIRRTNWFDPDDETRIVDVAFARRRPKTDAEGAVIDSGDDDGLSLFDSFHIDARACIEQEWSCHGLATLHVGTLRDAGLNVVRDPNDHRKVLITDMPFENPGEAESMLDRVAASARIHTRCKWKKPH
jgi:hypothetical protein